MADEETETDDLQEVTQPSLTYRIAGGHVRGNVDGQEAMRQAIGKILSTERFVWPIYTEQYGNDLIELIGKDMPYAETEVTRMLTEALEADDRVTDVDVTDIEAVSGDTLAVTATVTTIFGDLQVETEVAT
ncbi:DUF2634 domain-containing protein [Lacticaseibacillus hulanensis]|uniref:DUF2634 domain-containing protein n=1 Tax=Lacticaseibacillus hulanensis TaxID=2493111 RepID=UPI000FD7A375|nr:DUF2634 domain-containing protein [Lacticaseibacillus hulanensis]